jgi:hypothetical protein
MPTIGEITTAVVNFPLEKISNKNSSKLAKVLSAVLIGGFTIASLSAYGFYAHHYFKGKKVNPGDGSDPTNQKISKKSGEVLKGIKSEWTKKLQDSSTLSEELVETLSSPSDKAKNLEDLKKLSAQERTFMRDALLSYHQLFEEINQEKQSKGKEWQPDSNHQYENPLYTASFIIPDVAHIALKEDFIPNGADPTKPNLTLLHFLRRLSDVYMPHAHQNILGMAAARNAPNTKQIVIFQSIKKHLKEPSVLKFCESGISDTIYSKKGPLSFQKGRFVS